MMQASGSIHNSDMKSMNLRRKSWWSETKSNGYDVDVICYSYSHDLDSIKFGNESDNDSDKKTAIKIQQVF